MQEVEEADPQNLPNMKWDVLLVSLRALNKLWSGEEEVRLMVI